MQAESSKETAVEANEATADNKQIPKDANKQEEKTNETTKEAKEALADPNKALPQEADKNPPKQSSKGEQDKTSGSDVPGEKIGDDIKKTPSKVPESHDSSPDEATDETDEEYEESLISESDVLFIENLVSGVVPSETTMFMVDSEKQDLIRFYDVAFPDNSYVDIPEIPPPPPVKDYSVEKRHSDISVVLKPHYALSDADNYGIDIKQYLTTCKKLDVPVVFKVLGGLHKDGINLKYYGVHNEAVAAISEALTQNPHVKKLNLEDTWLNYEAVVNLAKMLELNKLLTHLNLKNCRIGPKGMEAMKMGIKLTQNLKLLDLTGNNIGDEGIEPLAEALIENWSITTLILSNNNLGTGASSHLAEFLRNNWSIKELDLSLNHLYPRQAMKPLMKAMGRNKGITHLNLSWNALSMGFCGQPIQIYLAKSKVVESLDLSWNRLEGVALNLIKNGCLRSRTLHTIILDNNPITPTDALTFLQGFTDPAAPLAEISMRDVWVNTDFLKALEDVKAVRPINVTIGGVFSNYILQGPDEKKLLFARANFECMQPKSKKKRKNFGYFVLKLEDKLIRRGKFRELVSKAKLPASHNLIGEIMKQFLGKRKRVDQNALKEYYLKLYPDTKLPVKKKRKRRGRKKGKKGKSDDTDTATSEPTTSGGETSEPTTSGGETSEPTTSGGETSEPTTSGGETSEPTTSGGETSGSEAETESVKSEAVSSKPETETAPSKAEAA